MLTKSIPYTFIRGGYFYFSRRVPADLQQHYRYPRVVQGLRTASISQAKVRANIAAAKLDAYWSHMRLIKSEVIGLSLVKEPNLGAGLLAITPCTPIKKPSESPTLLDALNMYLKQKGKGRPQTFKAAAVRSCNYVINVSGNKALSEYTRQDALQFRDFLVNRKLTGSSVTRNFSYVKAVINFALSELALDIRNQFTGVYHDRAAGVLVRKPIPIDGVHKVQTECRKIDDDMRWLIALVSDTGMRLAEAAGLSKADFIGLDCDAPHIHLIKHPWRNLKTTSSQRLIPLSGQALWAAKQIVSTPSPSEFAFPRYNTQSNTAANSASAALNKWLKQYVPSGCTMHSFRHSMRDRLRAVQCPADIVDQIGGWQTDGVGHSYGSGYPLDVLSVWMRKVTEHFGQYSVTAQRLPD
jgi:integrase